ncbi:MAG: glycosyltransferase [Bacteroidales bacterium]
MKIAFISTMNGSQWGGSEELWSKTALHALQSGHQVLVSVYDWGKLHPKIEALRKEGAIIHLRKIFNPDESLLKKAIGHFKNRYKALNRDYDEIFSFSPDRLLISQGGCYDVLIHHREFFRRILIHNIPYSVICHSNQEYSSIPGFPIYPEGKEFFSNASKVFLVARKMLEVLQRQLCMNIPAAQIVWNPLNISKHEILVYPKSDITNLAVIGYLGFTKGQDTLFEVLKEEKWKHRSWILNVYGSGYGLNYLEDLAKYRNISDKVIFHGQVGDIMQVWKENHALLIGSSVEWMPLTLMEAMLCGRVAIVPDIGGISELAVANSTAFIADSPSINAIDAAMNQAWNNRSNWEDMGKNAYAHAKSMIDLSPEQTLLNSIIG